VLNTSQNDWYPVLARDGSFMIFVSERPGGFGSSDLYITRNSGGVWQAPQNLGALVNSAQCESAPFWQLGTRCSTTPP
jgi:peptidoglycan-associated lipoprotein